MKIPRIRYAVAGLAGASLWASAWAGEVADDRLPSSTLGRDLRFTVYLPDGYREQPGPFPVVYLLHGAGGDEQDWVRQGGAPGTVDALVKRGLIRPVVVVMPTTGPSSWFADIPGRDRAETAFIRDLIPFVEAKYKVARGRKGRAVAGVSMGGYGALNLALKYPERFCGAALISPAVFEPVPSVLEVQSVAGVWRCHNYAAQLERYQQGSARVPIWILAGDQDALGIGPASASLFRRLSQIQPKLVELRSVVGGHEWTVFRDALPEALQYLDRHCARGE